MDNSNEVIVLTKNELKEVIKICFNEIMEKEMPEIIRKASEKPLMTKDELMELTGWSSRTIQHMRDSNQIPYMKHGRKILYPRKDFMEFMEESREDLKNKPFITKIG